MGTTSSTSNVPKQTKESLVINKIHPCHKRNPSNITIASSQRSLAIKLKPKLFEASITGSERLITSDSSCGSKKNGLLSKIKKRKVKPSGHLYDANLSTSVSSMSSFQTCSTSDSNTMAATEAVTSMILARYENEKDALLSQTISCSPCIASQNPELRLAALMNTNNPNCDVAPDSVTTVPAIQHDSVSYRSDCERNVKEWLSTFKFNGSNTSSSNQEIMLGLYLQPSNEDNRRKEKDRQQRLHYVLKRIWKKIYRSPLNNPTLIINWCCGIGIWDMEMAANFPNSKVVGIDYKESTMSNVQHGYPNLEFRYILGHDNATGLESFDDNSVDLIMLRDVWLVNSPSYRWFNIFEESYRILKPGGYIEIEEQLMGIICKGPYIAKLHDWYGQFYVKLQADMLIAKRIAEYLEQSGYENINEQGVTLPLGEWASTPGKLTIITHDITYKTIVYV